MRGLRWRGTVGSECGSFNRAPFVSDQKTRRVKIGVDLSGKETRRVIHRNNNAYRKEQQRDRIDSDTFSTLTRFTTVVQKISNSSLSIMRHDTVDQRQFSSSETERP